MPEINKTEIDRPIQMAVNEKEQSMLAALREISYGEAKIVMQNGVPVRIDEIRKTIKL